jgi:hypothetical protein
MSHYSGFSSASRLEIDRINKEKERLLLDQEKTKRENEELRRQLQAAQCKPGTSAQALGHDHGRFEQGKVVPSVVENVNLTPSRKRHSSQQLQHRAKSGCNRFEVLSQPVSYTDRSMRPDSVSSLPAFVSTQDEDPVSRPQQHNTGHVQAVFNITNDKAMRQELEINLETLNGNPFRGTLTQLEAKYSIYKESLKLDLSNFDGVRVGYKNGPMMVFKLKDAINVDELLPLQQFNFERKTSRQGRTHVDIIGCKIRGLRQHNVNSESSHPKRHGTLDDGTRLLKIEGCEYRVPGDALRDFLSHYGNLKSEIVEDVFEDGVNIEGDAGTNRTGTYSVTIKLDKNIPQLLPIMGKRVRVYYPGIQKLCPNCFGPHPKHVCQSRKVQWRVYVSNFISANPGIPRILFGKWMDNETLNYALNRELCINIPSVMEGPDKPGSPVDAIAINKATMNWVNVLDDTSPVDISVSSESTRPTLLVNQNLRDRPPLVTSPVRGPSREEFKVPLDELDHISMVERLVLGGLSSQEAEQTISSRKTAFNKACREFKKESGKVNRWQKKKNEKLSKTDCNNPNQNGI